MVRVRKSPNMISTTGRSPVIAAPTPMPVNPASEIGVSITRWAPNSSTSPERTLNGVPASATSSPKMHTRESRRISSASASRTAWANVSSRSGINVLIYLVSARIRSRDRELHRRFHFASRLSGDSIERSLIRVALLEQPAAVQRDGIAFRLPVLLFLLRAVVFAVNVAHVVPAVAVRVGLQECRSAAGARTLHQPRRHVINSAHILPVH